MKKVFVTGATGLLGTHVMIKLLKDGYFVTALVRKKSDYLDKKNENLKFVEGDRSTDVSSYLREIDVIVHIAAETRQNLIHYEEYRTVNYDFTVNLLTQAELSGVKKFIFISSANTLGYGSREDSGHEEKPQQYPFTVSLYAQSKLEAENYLLKNAQNTEVVILNPTFMIGAFDNKPSSGKIIFWAWKKKWIFYPKGGKNFVHAEDVADGVVKAIQKGKNREKYVLANDDLSYKEFFTKINKITHQNPMMIPIPNILLNVLGRLGDGMRRFKIKTNLSSVNMKALQVFNYYSNQKSKDELGMHYQSTDKAIADAIEYFEKKET
ncbi:NAD-dependent epimerase/dehydratase family protein [Chryseobacterium sp. PMSZPI]|uniref:NAD-dependent epimerase/dehydratase family protein n=1 Tax=Chryseobacterium sp. PMSZPI TaxID=1033900 RepID=UPI000C31EE61|nr:NAD-dependent epimerase/dehydratase family protein [Chryseobacterium sp. PMSZPI]PKF75706.1 dihydroflavonol 4-reductase [Chryseobacterium sp. PMSZPI]